MICKFFIGKKCTAVCDYLFVGRFTLLCILGPILFNFTHTSQVNCPMPAVKMLQCRIQIQLKQIRPQYSLTGHQYFDCVMSFVPQFCCRIGRSFHQTTIMKILIYFSRLIASSFRNAHITNAHNAMQSGPFSDR